MTKALKAHLRLMESLPVRTVPAKARPYELRGGGPGARPARDTQHLHGRILEMFELGYTRRQMADQLGVSLCSIGKHLNGKIKAAGSVRIAPPAKLGRPKKEEETK